MGMPAKIPWKTPAPEGIQYGGSGEDSEHHPGFPERRDCHDENLSPNKTRRPILTQLCVLKMLAVQHRTYINYFRGKSKLNFVEKYWKCELIELHIRLCVS